MTTSHSHWLKRTSTRRGHRLEAWCGATFRADHAILSSDDEPPPDACEVCKVAYDAAHATAVG